MQKGVPIPKTWFIRFNKSELNLTFQKLKGNTIKSNFDKVAKIFLQQHGLSDLIPIIKDMCL